MFGGTFKLVCDSGRVERRLLGGSSRIPSVNVVRCRFVHNRQLGSDFEFNIRHRRGRLTFLFIAFVEAFTLVRCVPSSPLPCFVVTRGSFCIEISTPPPPYTVLRGAAGPKQSVEPAAERLHSISSHPAYDRDTEVLALHGSPEAVQVSGP